jgi:hypothetical protein
MTGHNNHLRSPWIPLEIRPWWKYKNLLKLKVNNQTLSYAFTMSLLSVREGSTFIAESMSFRHAIFRSIIWGSLAQSFTLVIDNRYMSNRVWKCLEVRDFAPGVDGLFQKFDIQSKFFEEKSWLWTNPWSEGWFRCEARHAVWVLGKNGKKKKESKDHYVELLWGPIRDLTGPKLSQWCPLRARWGPIGAQRILNDSFFFFPRGPKQTDVHWKVFA